MLGLQPTGAFNARTKSDNLALAFQGLVTGIVRLQAGREKLDDMSKLRANVETTLREEVVPKARNLGFSDDQIREATYAVIAFLDEVAQATPEGRGVWSLMQTSIYPNARAVAGDQFFILLEGLLNQQDSQKLADLIEVFLLCLMLGYKGKYNNPDLAQELRALQMRVYERYRSIRGPANFTVDVPPGWTPPQPRRLPRTINNVVRRVWLPVVALISLGVAAALWVLYRVSLIAQAQAVVDNIVHTMSPPR
jgi:type VI secretion system protein ImpK